MDESEYLEKRVKDQIEYYEIKSKQNKNIYNILAISQLFLGVLIPFLSSISDHITFFEFLISIIGVMISVIVGLLAILKSQEKWIKYRTTCETLKHHKYKYLTRTRPYTTENSFLLFVSNIENLISVENSSWESLEKKNQNSC